MKQLFLSAALSAALLAPSLAFADAAYVKSIEDWRATVEKSLKRDNGWLTLAGRYVMKPGVNTIGAASGNDILLPKGVGPDKLGQVIVDGKMIVLKLADGITMKGKEGEFKGERVLLTDSSNRDWVTLGRMAFHVIERKGTYVLRLADNESEVRKQFAGRTWYDVNRAVKVAARFVPYPPGKTITIVDIIDELHDSPSPGYLEFELNGQTMRLDTVAEPGDKELFIILKDQTAGKGTYNSGRFLYVEWPEAVRKSGGPVTIDFNKVYNPPCAFSEFTTCPLPPKQNQLKVKLEAGEKYQAKKLAMN
ncbi:MAG: DUF1684 domain-containing protein [Betaproteobacteria bacterium]|nr:DUF1684 domain-containing protein [Betaproteobacteria bacterium]